ASDAAGDPAIDKVATNSAPALSADEQTLYIAVNALDNLAPGKPGYLLALDSGTLAIKASVRLIDPATRTRAVVSDDSTASPTVGPDGDVYFGVLGSTGHNGRGWMM